MAWRAVLGVLMVGVLMSTAYAGEPRCDLLDDPVAWSIMSDGLERTLRAACDRPATPVAIDGGFVRDSSITPQTIANGPDVPVNDRSGDPPNMPTQSECSVALRPSDGALVAAWNDSSDSASSPVAAFMGWGFSSDGGASWIDGGPVDMGALGMAVGDPDVGVNGEGVFTVSGMVSNGFSTGLAVLNSLDGGATLETAVSAHDGTTDDKVLMAIDRTGGANDGNVYLCWVDFALFDFNVVCTTSSDGAATFGPPVSICPGCPAGGYQAPFPVVGPDGALWVGYVSFDTFAGTSQIRLSRSVDGGTSFASITPPTDVFQGSSNALATTQCFRPALKGGVRYMDFPSMAVDPDGVVHVAFSQNGPDADDADVMYTHSDDDGATWSAPVRLSDDATTNDQFMPSIASNPNGILAVYWYDRREDAANLRYKVYMTRSLDGGATWTANQAVSDVDSPVWSGAETSTCYMGDYNKADADADSVYVIWSDNRNTTGGHPDPDVYIEAVPICDNADAAVSIDPPSGTYGQDDLPISVTLSVSGDDPACPEAGAIYYTTDGSDPATDGTLYTGAFEITEDTELRVAAFTCCAQALPEATASYDVEEPAPLDDDATDDDAGDDDDDDGAGGDDDDDSGGCSC